LSPEKGGKSKKEGELLGVKLTQGGGGGVSTITLLSRKRGSVCDNLGNRHAEDWNSFFGNLTKREGRNS